MTSRSSPQLYNLEDDIGESTNRANEHPEIVAQLMDHVEWARKDIGDYDRIGGARFFDPEPRRPDIARRAVLKPINICSSPLEL